MKSTLFWAVSLFMLAAPGRAQELPGDWQGVLKIAGRELRMVFKVSSQEGKLGAVLYSIDQGGQVAANTVTRDGTAIKISIAAAGITYEGKLGADGNSIAGTLLQAGTAVPLNLVRATPATAWAIPEARPPAKSMPTDAKPQFEVATIKPSKPEERFSMLVNPSGMFNTTASSISDLIKFAYDLNPRQISGAPAWFEMEKFSVSGKPDTPGIPSMTQLKDMVRGLLAERFALKFHFEKRTMSAYALGIAKSGVKMSKNETNPKGLPTFGSNGPQAVVVNATMSELATFLQQFALEQPVVDQTGLGAARYNFNLKYTPDPAQRRLTAIDSGAPAPPPPPDPDAPPDLFAALEQQAGLKLESTKAPVDVMVIEDVERPSAN